MCRDSKLALGTAQFGLDYGITNSCGQVSSASVGCLLTKAQEVGVAYIDTAQAYGNAEEVLGNALPSSHSFRVISKLPAQSTDALFDDSSEYRWQQSLELTLERMQLHYIDALLLHSAADLVRPDGFRLLHWLRDVKRLGLVGRIGVSIYDAADLEGLPLNDLQLVQMPCSLYDQRLVVDGTVDMLRSKGIAVHPVACICRVCL